MPHIPGLTATGTRALVLRLREFKHRYAFQYKYPPMAEAMRRFQASDSRKPAARIRREIRLCRKFWGCYPLHYFRLDLYRKERDLSDAELLNFIPEFFFYELFLHHHNPPRYNVLLEDKIITQGIFRSRSLPQPGGICSLIDSRLYSEEMEPVEYPAVEKELATTAGRKVFVKPALGSGGHGIMAFERREGGYLSPEGERFGPELLSRLGKGGHFLVEWGIEQADEVGRIHPHSVNTFRIATENLGGKVRILPCSLMRFGKGGNQVDNADSGGILIQYDADSGRTAEFGVNYLTKERFFSHPDSGIEFKTVHFPRWREIRDLAATGARKFPHLSYIGWDIALGKTGPVILEANSGFGLDGYNLVFHGMRDILGIERPRVYWEQAARGRR